MPENDTNHCKTIYITIQSLHISTHLGVKTPKDLGRGKVEVLDLHWFEVSTWPQILADRHVSLERGEDWVNTDNWFQVLPPIIQNICTGVMYSVSNSQKENSCFAELRIDYFTQWQILVNCKNIAQMLPGLWSQRSKRWWQSPLSAKKFPSSSGNHHENATWSWAGIWAGIWWDVYTFAGC